MTAQQPPDDSYPANWFPQLGGVQDQRQASNQREETLRRLAELPDDALAYALGEAILYKEDAV